ncbi:MAG: YjbE family putative metal transport protein [Clostridia bacterium]|nr:YjbE family putative metal transport protein [Clostridia bacterium]
MQLIDFLEKALQIMLVDLVLSGDNVGIIALAVSRLPRRLAGRAKLIGIGGALALRVTFVFFISMLLTATWLHIGLIGGAVLLLITWNMMRESAGPDASVRQESGFLRAVFSIIIADASMSFDNVLAIASIVIRDNQGGAIGARELGLIIFGLAFCVPVIFFGSSLVSGFMRKFPVILYICAGVLVNAALRMMLDDSLVAHFFAGYGHAVAFVLGLLTVAYGIISVYFGSEGES